ncbi:MAG TPA: methyltransferase domain-containing protein, partial [Pyrinomonadaceae bacterium]|nr:methyltransferase domain-containing protein [Pyrinomonadaceae bacterium]
ARAELANRLLPATRECPCCGWRGRRFLDYIEVGYAVRDAACPRCDSHPRHRAFYLWLRRDYPLAGRAGLALVFAPEKALAPLWEEARRLKVARVDIAAARGVDLRASLERLPFGSDSVDLIWCHHVLEHVERDREAIAELCRVLRPGTGELIVSVPMEPGTRTHEYGFADPRQSGHWRMYGDDFADRLAESGLTVEALAHDLSPQECRRYGIVPERFYICGKPAAAAARPAPAA